MPSTTRARRGSSVRRITAFIDPSGEVLARSVHERGVAAAAAGLGHLAEAGDVALERGLLWQSDALLLRGPCPAVDEVHGDLTQFALHFIEALLRFIERKRGALLQLVVKLPPRPGLHHIAGRRVLVVRGAAAADGIRQRGRVRIQAAQQFHAPGKSRLQRAEPREVARGLGVVGGIAMLQSFEQSLRHRIAGVGRERFG